MLNIIGVIPARFSSTRFPGKPLEKIAGKPLIQRVYEAASKNKTLNQCLVATDHAEIFACVKSFGGDVVMTDENLATGSDRVWQAIEHIDCDIVVNIQGDEPLLAESWLEKITQPLIDDYEHLDMVTLAKKIKADELDNKNIVKVVLDKDWNALYFSRFPIPFSREKNIDSLGYKHIGLYAYKKSFLKLFCQQQPTELEKAESLEQLRALYLGAKIKVVEVTEDSIGVDHPEDIFKVEQILKQKGLS